MHAGICAGGGPTPCAKARSYRDQRAAIEPIIGHLKSDHRLCRNFLKGIAGDAINLLLAATAWNLRTWLIVFFWRYFFLAYSQPGHRDEYVAIPVRW